MKLTDAQCRAAKPKDKPYKLSDGHGLYLYVQPNGSKLWRLKYRINGKERTASFGSYPSVSLGEARRKAEDLRSHKAAGHDPAQKKREAQRVARQNAEETFEVVTKEWIDVKGADWSDRHKANILNRMERDIFPEIGNMPIRDIKPPHVLDALRKIERRGAGEIARRLHQNCSAVFRYAVATTRLESDPSRDLKGALKTKKSGHYAAMSLERLPVFLTALNKNDKRLYPQTVRAVKLLMLTMTRTNELRLATWEEFNFDEALWVIPGKRMKMRKDHIVPLSRQAVALFQEQKASTGDWPWIFPNQVRPKNPMSDGTVLGAIRRLGFKGETTGHGFRALAMSTAMERLGYRHEVPDRQLAHAPKTRNDRAYVRAEFLDERKQLMQDWADYLDGVVGGAT